jgi:hypothetical protein
MCNSVSEEVTRWPVKDNIGDDAANRRPVPLTEKRAKSASKMTQIDNVQSDQKVTSDGASGFEFK